VVTLLRAYLAFMELIESFVTPCRLGICRVVLDLCFIAIHTIVNGGRKTYVNDLNGAFLQDFLDNLFFILGVKLRSQRSLGSLV
jgi:hypothetical protein